MTDPEFLDTMLAFIRWYFRTIEPEHLHAALQGRTEDQAATELLQDIIRDVQGNRQGGLSPADVGYVMDKVARLHLVTRYGPESVNIP